jgi:Helicase associated domain
MKYTAEHGTSRAPYDSVYKGVKVGQWASLQRSKYSKGKLSEERRRKLEELAGWEWAVA